MAMNSLPTILESIRRRRRPSLSAGITDAELLERFLQEHDEAAFELLMWRHGPMVYGVCRRILQHLQDVEDAFQVTFLILARKAASISKRESISSWLYMVAYRIALRSRLRNTRQSRLEQQLDDLPIDEKSTNPADQTAWRELSRLVDAELSRLPEKYRTAFILCHLEGKSCAEAAEHLGCPRGTILSRLGRARQRLQARLALRGWLPASTPLTHLLEQHASPLAQVTPVLIHATAHAALLVSLGKSLTGVVEPSVLELMYYTMSGLRLRKLLSLGLLALLALLGCSAFLWGLSPFQPEDNPAATVPPGKSITVPAPTPIAVSSPSPSCHSSSTLQEP